jgi:hypothetical protein
MIGGLVDKYVSRRPSLRFAVYVPSADTLMLYWLQFLSPALFLVACALPCLEFLEGKGKIDIMLGLRALAVGWSGIFAGITAWYANPVWLLGAVMVFWGRPIVGVFAGAFAVVIGLSTRKVIGRELPADEGNVNKMTLVRVHRGYYVWLASFATLTVASLVMHFAR